MRNILLLTEDRSQSDHLIEMTFKIACQCMANITLFKISKTSPQISVNTNGDLLPDEPDICDILEIARQYKLTMVPMWTFKPEITCLEVDEFNIGNIKKMVIEQGIWLLILAKPSLIQLRSREEICPIWQIINNSNCPVLLMPEHTNFSSVNQIAYATDLRYCNYEIIRFLKTFNASIYVTHISAPGLVDIEEQYAQDVLCNVISIKSNYFKMFLRNIGGKQICTTTDREFEMLNIKILSFFNKNHRTFERLLGEPNDSIWNYQQLPFLVFPFMNWHSTSLFYA